MAWFKNPWGTPPDSDIRLESIDAHTDTIHEEDVTTTEYDLNSTADTIIARVGAAIRKAGMRKETTEENLKSFRDYYLVSAINRLILTDILQKRNHTDDLISFTSRDPALQKILDDFEQNTDWEQLITDILPDLLFNGEYHLRLDQDNYVEDDVKQNTVTTAYKHGGVFGHYVKEKDETRRYSTPIYVRRIPRDFAHFSLNAFRERIDLNAKTTQRDANTPSAIRVGVSYFRPVADLLSSLRDSEVTLDAAQLSNMASDNIVGIEMPANTPPAAALRITSRYQKMLNASKTALTSTGQLSVSKVISALGQIKVLPLYTGGSGSTKGSLNKLDVKNDTSTSDILESIKDKRDAVLGTLGIPSGVIFANLDINSQQANTLKRYSRYSKSLTLIQNGIVQGITQLAYAYLSSFPGVVFDKEDIAIAFNYKQPELSMLDHLEIVSTSLQSLQDLDEYLATLVQDETVNDLVTASIRKEVIVRNLSLVIGRNLLTPGDGDGSDIFKVGSKDKVSDPTPDQQPAAGTESVPDDEIPYTSDDIDKTWPEISR